VALINQAVDAGARLEVTCRFVGISVRTLQRWRGDPAGEDQRRGPRTPVKHKLTREEEEEIVRYATSKEYRNMTPDQIVAKLVDKAIYICSERTLYRILKRRKLDAYRGTSKSPVARSKPAEHGAEGPLEVLSWDITYLRNARVRGSYFYLYMYIDIFSRKIVSYAVHEEQSAELAAELLRELCVKHQVKASDGFVLHSDNGGPMKGSTMLATMHALGIVASFSRPSVSNDNPYIESLFRHLKYAPSYPAKGFKSIDEARQWVSEFVDWYNTHHLHSGIGLVTPNDRHEGRDLSILENRREVYRRAREKNPVRWTGKTRSWDRPTTVVLNPERTVRLERTRQDAAA
jgi:putative transposase